MAQKTITKYIPFLVYGGLTLAVMAPLLMSGYILTLDMVFTPELRMPDQLSSSWLFHAMLYGLNVVIPSQILQKILLIGILLGSGLGMFWLARRVQKTVKTQNEFAYPGALLAGALYMINPFVYARFMAGQYAVLLGYALLPFVVRALLDFFSAPSLRRGLIVAAWTIAIGVVSVHTLGLIAIIALPMLIAFTWKFHAKVGYIKHVATFGAAGLALFLLASSYWLIPLITGDSSQGQAVQGFGASDQAAFATTGGNVFMQLLNVLGLQGFWAEAYNVFLLPQTRAAVWPFAVLLIWALIGFGIVWLWRAKRLLAIVFIASSVLAILIALFGVGNWLPGLAGFREPHKFIGVLALAFALFAGFGSAALLAKIKEKWDETACGVAAIFIAILPLLFAPTMFWGFNRQLVATNYPADWSTMNQQLNQDESVKRVLFLPWHLYINLPFAGRPIENPAEKFFDKPVIVSNELEFMNAAPTFPDAEKTKITKEILPNAPQQTNLGEQLRALGITHVLLTKRFDLASFDYLNNQQDLQLVNETENFKLYKVVNP